MATATVYYYERAHDGPGYYWVDDEYPEEGSAGAFQTMAEAMADAEAESGCDVVELSETCIADARAAGKADALASDAGAGETKA